MNEHCRPCDEMYAMADNELFTEKTNLGILSILLILILGNHMIKYTNINPQIRKPLLPQDRRRAEPSRVELIMILNEQQIHIQDTKTYYTAIVKKGSRNSGKVTAAAAAASLT